MAFFTLDFETAYRTRKNKGTPGPAVSLKNLTYEEYLRGSWVRNGEEIKVPFKAHGVGIKIDREDTFWVTHSDLEYALKHHFPKGNKHTVVAHNTMFDGAIMRWVYGVSAETWYDTKGMSQALWPTESASLDALTRRLFPDDKSLWKDKDALEVSDGYWDLSPEQEKITADYCIQDTDITFNAFAKMWSMGFPQEELKINDITLRMFIERPFEMDHKLLLDHRETYNAEKDRIIAASNWGRTTLASNKQFAARLKKEHGIVIEEVPSPTEKNPDNMKLPLAKDDLEFLELRSAHPELDHIWQGRLAATSNSERTRIDRFLNHGMVSPINPEGHLAQPLNYYAAHTGRWGGTNKQNPQNLGRKSKLRLALRAPKGKKVVVRDLSNIEGRMSAWFCGQDDKLELIASGGDIYNEMATAIYGYPVFRKNPEHATEGFVGKVAELGLGFGMGAAKFRHTLLSGAMGMVVDLTEEECRDVVYTYRKKNNMISGMWRRLQGVIADMANPNLEPYEFVCLRVEYQRLVMPNGLSLVYPDLQPIEHPDAYNEYDYWQGKYRKKLWGGLILENCIQALSRIVMSEAMVRIDAQLKEHDAGMLALTVHDENVAIVDEKDAEWCNQMMDTEMSKTPAWCDSRLVLATDGGIDDCYSK
ncbi:DNA polymerase [Kistimonas scapharcae]|uniref:DNA polymerase I n=1 Tax=Kistimonas scapharcae TaxID=1036133 RepID=A0ABP8UX14_9GAMM